jgi:hypothetical protein
MFHVYWPAVAILSLIVISVILIILMYGDKICTRVKTQTETIRTRRVQGREQRQRSMELQRQKASYGHEIEVWIRTGLDWSKSMPCNVMLI